MRTAVIMTAISVETSHVLHHLASPGEDVVNGTVFATGRFDGASGPWRVVVAEMGAGNLPAAALTERALNHYKPDAALFVGVAGGVKDVRLGDVVAGTKIYGYESGKVTDGGFKPRPNLVMVDHGLEQRARSVARSGKWRDRLRYRPPGDGRKALIGPIAAGEKVVASVEDALYKFLKDTYGDTLAVEMEGRGFMEGVHVNRTVAGLVVRGISDLLAGKAAADATGSQELAADSAAAFAFEILSALPDERVGREAPKAAPDFLSIRQQVWQEDLSPPGALLRADFGIVPFHGRTQEMRNLSQWCDGGGTTAVRLYTGPGGMGKTRLFLEFCEQRVKEAGWRAGFVDGASAPRNREGWSEALDPDHPTLLVIDYAETSQDLLEPLLTDLTARDRGRFRVILLARAAGDWWELLKSSGSKVGDLLSGPATRSLRLQPLAHSPADRHASYLMALDNFARVLGRGADGLDEPDFAAPLYERVLLLHMAALCAIDKVPVRDEDGILDYILWRERRFWTRRAEQAELSAYVAKGIGQAMAVLTLGGGCRDAGHALKVLEQVPFLRGESAAALSAVADILHDAYPGEKMWIETLMPDILGEHLVERELERKGQMDSLFELVFGPKEPGREASPPVH